MKRIFHPSQIYSVHMHLLKSIKAHSDKAWSVSSHPTVPLLATASTDRTSKIYRLSEGFPLLATLEDTHKRLVRLVAFKPPLEGVDDLPVVASGSFDSTISVWGVEEPEDDDMLASEWNLMAVIEGHENEIKAVAWNHSGNLLASCSRDKTVWIWETDPETLEEFECISVLNDHQHDVKHIAWHPALNLLASSLYDDTIRVYREDDDDWLCVGVLNGHSGTVWCLAFEMSEDSTLRLVSASDDMSVRIWLAQHAAQSSLSSIRQEMVWEQETVLPMVHTYPVYSVAWSAVSGRIASTGADGKIAIYRFGTLWEVEAVHESCHGVHEVNCVQFCKLEDGTEVVVSAGDDGAINVWSV